MPISAIFFFIPQPIEEAFSQWMVLLYSAGFILAYLIGSIPFGYIIVRYFKGIDIRTVGSKNIGATNVRRVMGLPAGIACFILDALKGVIPTLIFPAIILNTLHYLDAHSCSVQVQHNYLFVIPFKISIEILIGLFVIIGHLFPVYLRFKGGKGVATGLGVFIIITPKVTLVSVVAWLIFLFVLRHVSLASIITALFLPINYYGERYLTYHDTSIPTQYWMYYEFPSFVFFSIISLLIIIRHIPNIKRLVAGTEPKVRLWGKKPQTVGTDEHK